MAAAEAAASVAPAPRPASPKQRHLLTGFLQACLADEDNLYSTIPRGERSSPFDDSGKCLTVTARSSARQCLHKPK